MFSTPSSQCYVEKSFGFFSENPLRLDILVPSGSNTWEKNMREGKREFFHELEHNLGKEAVACFR